MVALLTLDSTGKATEMLRNSPHMAKHDSAKQEFPPLLYENKEALHPFRGSGFQPPLTCEAFVPGAKREASRVTAS